MFDNLSDRLQTVFKKLRGYGKLTESNIQEGLREVRLALLEADVNYKTVKEFIEKVKEKAIGDQVLKSLSPGQQVVKIVHEEMVALMGGEYKELAPSPHPPTSIMLIGLQGSGKTTTAAKLANLFQKQRRKVLLVAADPYRPAAIDQLTILGQQLGIAVYTDKEAKNAVKICQDAHQFARSGGYTYMIMDTAGRLHIDEELMQELREIKRVVNPQEVILVADAMTGQDAVNIAKAFDQEVGIGSVILTKIDGDARGGAALSIRAVTGKPIRYVGTGEKIDALEPFYPDRMASRILGMGDVLSLIEKAQAAYSEEKARDLRKKIARDAFTLEDFRDQLRQIRKLGPLEQIIGMIPGGKKILKNTDLKADEKKLIQIEAIINSMTVQERNNAEIINGSRRKRIAKGSGTTVQDVNQVLSQFTQMQRALRQMKKMGMIPGFGGNPFRKKRR
ncbi:MAG: signal recognition particle protein [bacterium]|nr:signal recognition particle protein [bacterium]